MIGEDSCTAEAADGCFALIGLFSEVHWVVWTTDCLCIYCRGIANGAIHNMIVGDGPNLKDHVIPIASCSALYHIH